MNEERAREGVEHLQNAARELIEAARAFLDVAEEAVEDPAALKPLVGTLVELADLAAGRMRASGAETGSGADDPARPAASKRVERIPVT